MVRTTAFLFIGSFAVLASALPAKVFSLKRAVASLNRPAFEEAHRRDETATRAFEKVSIKTANGRCLFVDELSGDFRANLTPIQVAACDGSEEQKWDIITAGKHNNQPGTMLVASAFTNACLNFDPRREAGSQVMLFSCGGRADGGGEVTDSQLFPFDGTAGPLTFSPRNEAGTCFTVSGANVLDKAACNGNDANQFFTFGDNFATSTPALGASAIACTP